MILPLNMIKFTTEVLKIRFISFISRNTLLNQFMPGEKLIETANIWLSCCEYIISARQLWWICLSTLEGVSKYAKTSQSVKKKSNLNYGMMAITLNPRLTKLFL